MNKRLQLLVVALTGIVFPASAQMDNPIAMPNVIPPTPDAAQIAKPAQVNLGKFTGTAQFAIPLHKIQYRDVNIPIAVNYNSNGVKVDQVPSRVGIDWSLDAGGVITRTVMHEDDEKKPRQTPPSSLTNLTDLATYVYPFFVFENDEYADTQADEFTYSASGIEGKFILDHNKDVVPITISEHRIEKHANFGTNAIDWDFRITNGNGAIYFFGGQGARDKSKTESEGCGRNKYDVEATVAYHLKRVVYPNGDQVNFTYEALSMYIYYTGVMESIVRLYPSQLTDCGSAAKNVVCEMSPEANMCTCAPFDETPISTPATACPIKITTNSVILSEIIASDGTKAKFHYSTRQDQAGDRKYDSLIVSRGTSLVKRFSFQYTYSTATNYYTGNFYNSANIPYEYKRLFLTRIFARQSDYSGTPMIHEFEYDDINALPPRLSSAQDHFGYFNGKKNNFYVPAISDEADQFSMIVQTVSYEAEKLFFEQGGNREPDFQFAKKGSLKSIKYPTGGVTEIDWEANTINKNIINYPVEQSRTVGAIGTGLSGAVSAVSTNMVVNYAQRIRISGSATALGTHDPTHNSVEITLKTLGGSTLYTKILKAGDHIATKISVSGGETYRIHITTYGNGISGTASAYFRPGDTTHQLMNIEMPGLRVKRLREMDKAGDTITRRYYYTQALDTTKSSGVSVKLAYFNDFDIHKWCWDQCMDTYIGPVHFGKLSSSTLFPLHLYGQNPVNYTYVTESLGEAFAGGCTEYKYTISLDGANQILNGQEIYNAPRSNNGFMNGTPEREDIYRNAQGILVPAQKTRYVYSFDSRNFSWYNSLVLFQKHHPSIYVGSGPTDINILRFFDIAAYPRYSYWIHLDSTIRETYDWSGVTKMTNIETSVFGSLQHYQPTELAKIGSKGEILKTQFRYPHDSVSTGNVYDTMVKRNIILPWVEMKKKYNSADLETYRRKFDFNWFPDKHLVAVKNVDLQRAGFQNQVRLRNEKYSTYGDILSARSENDIYVSNVWDQKNSQLLAQVTNAAEIDIAFTSFESEANGNWTYTGYTINDAQTSSGYKVYNLTAFTSLLKTGLTHSTTYVVSYWTKNSTPYSVTGTIANYPIAGAVINGWKFYQHLVTNTTQVYISGTGLIDEVRLHPTLSQMSTFCYEQSGLLRSSFDINNRGTTYYYDGFNSLLLVKDLEQNIIKKICYSYAEPGTDCVIYENVAVIDSFTRANCEYGYSGTKVAYSVPAGKYISIYSQEDADKKAARDLAEYGQTYANNAGQCFIGCSSPYCVGNDKKCIAGRCSTGVKVVTSVVRLGTHLWECTYHYEWSDGSWSPNYTEQSITNCSIIEM